MLKRYTNNAEAYQLLLKGRYHWYKFTPENVRKSRDYFQEAIELDPTYAPGYAGLSEYFGLSSALGMMSPNDGWSLAESAMLKAQKLDDTLPEVHNGLAAIRMFYYRDWNGAEQEIKRTIELNPKFAEVHSLYSFCLVAVGKLGDAIAEARKALELDPLSPTYNRYLGYWLYYAGHYEEAIGQYQQAIELDPNNTFLHAELGEVFNQAGLHREAVAEWRQELKLNDDDELVELLSHTYVESDFTAIVHAFARKKIELMKTRAESGAFVSAIGFARAYLMLGDKEQVFQWLEKAVEERNIFPLLMNFDPFYDSLRSDTRFQDLMRHVGFIS